MNRMVILILLLLNYGCREVSTNDVDLKGILSQYYANEIDTIYVKNYGSYSPVYGSCFKEDIRDTLGRPTTLTMITKKNEDVEIEEIKFRNIKSLEKAYNKLNKYSVKVRNMNRGQFYKLCFELPEYQFYYVVKKRSSLYLISCKLSNFASSKKELTNLHTTEEIVRVNEKIIMDDVFNVLNKIRD